MRTENPYGFDKPVMKDIINLLSRLTGFDSRKLYDLMSIRHLDRHDREHSIYATAHSYVRHVFEAHHALGKSWSEALKWFEQPDYPTGHPLVVVLKAVATRTFLKDYPKDRRTRKPEDVFDDTFMALQGALNEKAAAERRARRPRRRWGQRN